MPEEAGLADVIAEQRELLSRLRAVVEARDTENQVLRADPPAQCRRRGAGLGGAAPAAPGWAQVVDVQVTRTVTEWLLPGLQCPCCGTAAVAGPPSGAHAGSAAAR